MRTAVQEISATIQELDEISISISEIMSEQSAAMQEISNSARSL
jgi:methyl-accepting chemotaxis protein